MNKHLLLLLLALLCSLYLHLIQMMI